ncbi:MAG TPA: hypothetical protein VD866_12980 [Urbifossiella sp.]|nr:hypothetical protein [Urbifossiella sp.]
MFGLVLTAALAPAAPPVDPDPKHLVVPPAEQARAAALVEKLGSPRYDEREKAQDDLAAMGRKAVPALTEALARHASAEVRARCQTIYPRARADDLEARLAVFVADEGGKFEHDLPGWPEFRQVTAGCGPVARTVFAEIVANPLGRELLITDLPPQDLGLRIALRKQEMYQKRYNPTRPGQVQEPAAVEVLALMLAETRVPSRHVPRSNFSVIIYQSSGFVSAINGGTQARVYRAIAGKWVASRDDAVLMVQALSVGQALDLPEVADLGARMVKTAAVTPLNKAQAAMAVAKVGNAKHLPALESAFKDEAPLAVAGVIIAGPGGAPVAKAPPAMQLRDVALAAALLLTQQDPTEYGFEVTNPPPRATTRLQYTTWRLTAERRAAAFEKWAEWRAANPDYGQIR